jgi:predicted RNase H-like HicB family nuclease
MATSRFAVVLEPDEEGGFTVLVPSLPGVVTQGESVEEALDNARDAIALTLAGENFAPRHTDRAELFQVDVALS